MSISSSLYSGISGLSTLGNSMAVIGDNIANVNTVAFKSSRVTFQDLLAQSVSVASGTSQVGRGVRLSNVGATFSQGSFENTSSATDLAIGGNGFFIMEARDTGDQYYTRAGQFSFDQEGYLVNPEGYVVQGWGLDPVSGEDQGAITDIKLDDFSSPPGETSLLQMSTNLDSRKTLEVAPGTSLVTSWDASNDPPMGPTSYEYQTAVTMYDTLGTEHTLTLYYDRTHADNQYEFLLALDPSEDNNAVLKGNQAGALMTGIIKYSGDGSMNSYQYIATKDNDANNTLYTQVTADPIPVGGWAATGTPDVYTNDLPTPGNGYVLNSSSFTAFLTNEVVSLDEVVADGDYYIDSSNGRIYSYNSAGLPFAAMTADYETYDPGSGWTAASIGGNNYPVFTVDFGQGNQNVELNLGLLWDAGPSRWSRDTSFTSTQYASAASTISQSQDGYPPGYLQNVTVDADGVMEGRYSNGQVTALYRVALANFNNPWELTKRGGNLYAGNQRTGDPSTAHPGTNGMGGIASNSLEQSNVDLADQFVKMIIMQRGFQANSRIITTTDNMLQELINLKR